MLKDECPPGGACSRVVDRSVRTLPVFWEDPDAKALDPCDPAVAPPNAKALCCAILWPLATPSGPILRCRRIARKARPYRGWAAPVWGSGGLGAPRPLQRCCRAAEVGWIGTGASSSLLEAVAGVPAPLLSPAPARAAPACTRDKGRRCRRAAALPPPAPQSPPNAAAARLPRWAG